MGEERGLRKGVAREGLEKETKRNLKTPPFIRISRSDPAM